MWDFLSLLLKYLAYGFIIAIYAAFPLLGKTMPSDLLIVLTGALGVLGTVHITSVATKATATPPKVDPKDTPL